MNYIRESRLTLLLSLVAALILLASVIPISSGNAVKRQRNSVEDDDAKPAAATPNTLGKVPRTLDFKEYVIKFNKNYGATELMAKANLFLVRVINIFKHNAQFLQQKYNYFLAPNEFTDISAAGFEAMGVKDDPALVTVEETKLYPANMPASELPSVQQLTGSEGFSMSAANDDDEQSTGAYEARYGGNKTTKQVFVDFSKDDSGPVEQVNIRDFYREFKASMPALEAEQVEKVIDLGKNFDENQANEEEKSLRKSDPKSEKAMIRRKIKYKPMVKSNNANYDSSRIKSHGVYDKMSAGRAFSDKMAAFLDYDVDIMEDLKPYEPPSKKTRTKAEEEHDQEPKKSSYFSSFFSTAKEVAKSVATTLLTDDGYLGFDNDDGDGDEELDDETTEQIDRKTKEQNEANAEKIKYSVDWRVTGCITRPKSQSSCNACYAFTVVALMEYYHCRQTKELTEFSAQYIVDCGRGLKLNGCQGGYLGQVGKFVSMHGLELQAMYPYSGLDGQCPYASSESAKMGYLRPKILNWIYVKKMSDWYVHVRKGPLLVGIGMPSDFLAYGGGIHDGLDCNPDKVHAMLLVGSGSQGGKEFWLFKNSFSSDWGENGYFRLAKDAPLKCFNSGVVVRVDFKQGEAKNPDHQPRQQAIANI